MANFMSNFMPGEWDWQKGNPDIAPTDDASVALLLKRRLAQADALRNAEMPQGQMVSGHYVAPSWTQQLANFAGKYVGGQEAEKAMQDYSQAQATKAQKLGDIILKGKTVFEPDEQGNQREVQKPYSNEELIGELSKIDPAYGTDLLKQYMASRYKEDVGQVMTPGSTFVKGGKPIYTAPALPKERNLPSAIEEYQFAQGQGFKGSFEDWKRQNKTEGVAIYGAPVAGTDAQGRPVFFQPSKSGGNPTIIPGVTPPAAKLKEPPPTARQAYSGNKASLDIIDKAIDEVEKSPDDYFGFKGGLGNTYMSRMYPQAAGVRQKINAVSSAKRHELSGTAVTPSENAATAELLPQRTDDRKTILTKLRGLREIYKQQNDAIAGSFGDEYTPLQTQQSNDGWTAREKK